MTQYRSDSNTLLPTNKTIYEVVRLSDRVTPSGTMTDGFGRLRTSQPFTLFDSQHRYTVNELWHTSNTGTANANTEYVVHESAVNMHVGTNATDSTLRETKRVFAYQPGKSLLILNTFTMAEAQANLVQRVGYFGTYNGVYLEKNEANTCFVLRSNSSGTIVETRVAQEDWNRDTFDGSANSYASTISTSNRGALNTSNTNIFWIDLEWLGVGDVRCGFIVDGLLIPAHIFHHDNLKTKPYMTTAILPTRLEIFNTGITANNSTLKQICTSVISEGGYELRGKPRSVGRAASNTFVMSATDTWYPIISIRLKSDQLDAVVLPKGVSALAEGNNGRAKYGLIINGALSGNTTYESVSSTSAVEYNYQANGITGGTVLAQGYLGITNQTAAEVNLRGELFTYQLTRNTFSSSAETLTLAMQAGTSNDTGIGSIDWEEIS